MKIIDINNQERECEDAYLDPKWPGYVTVKFISKHRKGHSHTEWYPIDKFVANNPKLEYIVKNKNIPTSPIEEIAGVVTGADSDSLRDSTANWTKNAYSGFYVWISRGKAEGQVRTILSNTAKSIKIDKPWDKPRPNKTSQYAIVSNIGDVKAQGNSLAIEDIKKLEEKARKLDLERGREPAPKQYT